MVALEIGETLIMIWQSSSTPSVASAASLDLVALAAFLAAPMVVNLKEKKAAQTVVTNCLEREAQALQAPEPRQIGGNCPVLAACFRTGYGVQAGIGTIQLFLPQQHQLHVAHSRKSPQLPRVAQRRSP
ncbi:unnamed protein product [Cylicostephanus goldi]|uniref:Uncharacterized protein n=1 Tax=Cylicostephanus goldi TaxID=71465 RepID=A0A3P6UGA9_CYLGO|nr:unnamed protein product [Cylicostephanus goldi]